MIACSGNALPETQPYAGTSSRKTCSYGLHHDPTKSPAAGSRRTNPLESLLPFPAWVLQPALEGPAPASAQPTRRQGRRYVGATITVAAPSAMPAPSPIHAISPVVVRGTPQRFAPSAPPPEPRPAHTSLRYSQFETELALHPNKAWISWLLDGIDNGVRIGYSGSRTSLTARNLRSAYLQSHAIDKELQREVEAGHILGPFTHKPFPTLHCSGLGAIPKKNGKWRVIMHLSAPPGTSINDHISRDDYSLTYSSVDDAVRILSQLGRGALMAKADLRAAFRMVPVHPEDWDRLGIFWRGCYYVDTRLPFGLRSAPFLFNQYAEALLWIIQHNYSIHHSIHYLDDYFFAASPASSLCQIHIGQFLTACQRLGVPVAMDKLEGPTTCLTFLGIQLDSNSQQLRLPDEKLFELQTLISSWLGRRKTTKRKLLSIIGKLAFAARVVPAGRLFLRRMIDLASTAKQLHHRIRLTHEARADLEWWHSFLPSWNGVAMFLDPDWTPAEDMELFTDASGTLGYGAYYNGSWLRAAWAPHQLPPHVSIQWQELFAILAAAIT